MNAPAAAAPSCVLQPGVVALPHSLTWLERSRALIVADAHLAYEEVIGGALPLWSTREALALLQSAIDRMGASEVIFLGDIVHGSRMSDGAARVVANALKRLRTACTVTLVAGNHEGRTRGASVLGATEEWVERDGWQLVHGDGPAAAAARRIIGHLHPAIALGCGNSTPVFLASSRLIVAPALTPYSTGLNVLSRSCAQALLALDCLPRDFTVVASGDACVYPFGTLTALKRVTARAGSPSRSARNRLQSG
ncbi:MAG: metallophosphoesterase [Vulcanimicrobiaceae bacterium]